MLLSPSKGSPLITSGMWTLRLWFIISHTSHKAWESVESKVYSAWSLRAHIRRAHVPICSSSYVEFTLDWSIQSLHLSYLLENNRNTWTSAKPYLNTGLSTWWDWTGRKNGQKGPLPSTNSLGHSTFPLLSHVPPEDFVLFRTQNHGLSSTEGRLSLQCWRWFTLSKILDLYEPATVPAVHHSAEKRRAWAPPFHCYAGSCLFLHIKPE